MQEFCVECRQWRWGCSRRYRTGPHKGKVLCADCRRSIRRDKRRDRAKKEKAQRGATDRILDGWGAASRIVDKHGRAGGNE